MYSTEVEFVLYQHPEVLEATGWNPAPVWGETVTTAVVARPGMALTEEELVVRFLTELPKTGAGKILKRAIAR